jgi:hypothetical protein
MKTTDIAKAFLFDVISKIYIATDRSPVDIPSYEICSDFIDVVIDVSDIYGYSPDLTMLTSGCMSGKIWIIYPPTKRKHPR